MGSEVVTAEDVKVITTVQITNKIFDMVAAITAGKTKRAMDLYEDLLTLREPPMRILFLIARQFNQLCWCENCRRPAQTGGRLPRN